mgnify:CR=1 FL=1
MIDRIAEVMTRDGKMETFIACPHANGPHAAFIVYMYIWGVREELFDIARQAVIAGVRGDAMRVTPHLYNSDADAARLLEVLSASV